MIDQLNQAINDYQNKWQVLLTEVNNAVFFESQVPTAAAWKTTDRDELLSYFAELRDQCDQVHFGWLNGRWLVTMHLKDSKLQAGIQIIKLMERRPGSSDAVGLDHLDFWNSQNEQAEQILGREPKLKWSHESNNPHCSYVSVRFKDTEAKLRTDTVLQPCIAELKELQSMILEESHETPA